MLSRLKALNVKKSFFIATAVTFVAVEMLFILFVISWTNPVSIFLFFLISIFLYSFSLQITKKIFSIFLKPYSLGKLGSLTSKPKVAILYATMNDILPECLMKIDQSYPCDVFVLDDSTDPHKRQIVDDIANDRRFPILRRSERKGFKAGAINNWMNLYGKSYDYFVLLDSDSYIPHDWVEKSLLYAEEPSNSKVAIFQGLINIWNLDNRFIRTLSSMHKIGQDIWELKMANYLDAIFCYGHNVLIRMKPVLEVGGFVEGYTSEDFATAIRLAKSGYKSRFIPLHTYEAMPENIRGFIKRQHKWIRGSMEFLEFIKEKNISLSQKVILFTIPLGHFSYVAILAAMFITVFFYPTTFGNVNTFLTNLYYYHIFFIWSIPIFRFAIMMKVFSAVINGIKMRQLGINYFQSFKHEMLSKAIGAIMLPYEMKSLFNYIVSRKVQWPVTPKHETRLTIKDVLYISKITMVLSVIFLAGLIFVNPLGFIFNVSWLVPFLAAPLTLYLYSNDKVTKYPEFHTKGGIY
ncbi:MAG: glycosyltransferase family 2 protein [Candidatus Aenigmatarchaeota archaeon]